jgi:hypothetical protein
VALLCLPTSFCLEDALVRAAPALRQISLDGGLLWGGIQRAAASTDEPILGIAHGQTLTFVVIRGGGLVLSWRFPLPRAVDGSFVFGVPTMISSHLVTHLASGTGAVHLALNGPEVTLATHDIAGSYELRWRFDLNTFPAPPDLGRLLVPPGTLLSMDYLQVADAIHRAVARLARIEQEGQVHRTKLAILLALANGDLLIEAHEIALWEQDCYYFDPRLVMRALECIRGPRVWVGLTALEPRRAFFSLVDRQPGCLTHCALLSIGQDTQRLISPHIK